MSLNRCEFKDDENSLEKFRQEYSNQIQKYKYCMIKLILSAHINQSTLKIIIEYLGFVIYLEKENAFLINGMKCETDSIVVGRGGYGNVIAYKSDNETIKVAVKIPTQSFINVKDWIDEMKFWNLVHDHSPAKLIMLDRSVLLVMPYMGEYSFFDGMKTLASNAEDRLRMLLGLGIELKKIHDKKISHNDFNGRNIRVFKGMTQYNVYIVDFGCAITGEHIDYQSDISDFCRMIAASQQKYQLLGTNQSHLKNAYQKSSVTSLTNLISAIQFEIANVTKSFAEKEQLLSKILMNVSLENENKDLYLDTKKMLEVMKNMNSSKNPNNRYLGEIFSTSREKIMGTLNKSNESDKDVEMTSESNSTSFSL